MKFRKQIICLLLIGSAVGSAFAQTQPGAFIDRHCNSTSALVNHVKTDAKVMDHYMRHFAMTSEEVVAFLSTLKLTTLESEGLYVVYGVPDSGLIRSKMTKVKKGTKVWVDQAGELVLIWSCGNPVTRGPKIPYDSSKPVASATGAPMENLRDIPLQSPASITQSSISIMPEPSVPEVPVIPDTNREIPIIPSSRDLGFLGILPILGVIRNDHKNAPVPEPATMAIFGIGAAGMVMRKRKSKSK